MWFIKSAGGDIIYLKPNRSMVVSRKAGHDIVLNDDASISKIHATIVVRPKINFQHNEPSSDVFVKDASSKYGTFVIHRNGKTEKLTATEYPLNESLKVKFGLQSNIFTLHYVPFIISTSTLNSKEKVELQNIIDTVDGVIIEKWEEYCTHLTVSNVTLTTQVVRALAFCTPIVSLAYWRAVLRSVESSGELPDAETFTPSISEGTINRDSVSLRINKQRRVVFKNIAFVCFSQSQHSLKDIVKSAGGKLAMFKEGKFSVNQLCSKNVVVLQPSDDSSEPSQASVASYDSVQKALQQSKRRLVPESEIFLAILYCSVEKYCNPSFDFKRLIGTSERNRNKDLLSTTVLAPDTEEIMPTRRTQGKIIPESLTASEKILEQDSIKMKKNLSLRKKPNADNSEESSRAAVGNRRILDRSALGSEESSREGALMIDETRSSAESDSSDFGVFQNKQKASTTRRFDLDSKLQTGIVKKEKVESAKRPDRNDLPSTSKEPTWKRGRDSESAMENEEISSLKRPKNEEREKSPQEIVKKPGFTSSKRARAEEEDLFAIVNEGAAKRQKNVRNDEDNDLFVLFEDLKAAPDADEVENIFGKELQKREKVQIKRRRSSLSSNDSSIDEEPPRVKEERVDSEDEVDAPLIRCKKEFDSSMNETCKSTLVSLLRPDIDLTLNSTAGNMKTFIKMYTAIPKQRIKLTDMYVWKNENESIKSVHPGEKEALTSGTDEDEIDLFQSHKAVKKTKRRA